MATVAFAFVAETAAAGETVAFTTAPDWAFARTVDPSVGLARASVGEATASAIVNETGSDTPAA